MLHRWPVYRSVFGPAGQQLTTLHGAAQPDRDGLPGCELGIVAGDRSVNLLLSAFVLPRPNDGKVTVQSTKLPGMTDHVVVRSPHPWLMRDAAAIEQTIAFLRHGRFLPTRPSAWAKLPAAASRKAAFSDPSDA